MLRAYGLKICTLTIYIQEVTQWVKGKLFRVHCRNASNMETNCCIIDKLKVRSFQTLTFCEKEDVIKAGPSKPVLNITTNIKKCVRHFNVKIYESESWLWGCKTLNKLFYWSCLLFSNEKSVWNTNGYEDLNNIYKAAKKHNYFCNHIIFEKTTKNVRGNSKESHRRNSVG